LLILLSISKLAFNAVLLVADDFDEDLLLNEAVCRFLGYLVL
jgi:hypothetical protein